MRSSPKRYPSTVEYYLNELVKVTHEGHDAISLNRDKEIRTTKRNPFVGEKIIKGR